MFFNGSKSAFDEFANNEINTFSYQARELYDKLRYVIARYSGTITVIMLIITVIVVAKKVHEEQGAQ